PTARVRDETLPSAPHPAPWHHPHRSTLDPHPRVVRPQPVPRAPQRYVWSAPPEILRGPHVRGEASRAAGGESLPGERRDPAPQARGATHLARRLTRSPNKRDALRPAETVRAGRPGTRARQKAVLVAARDRRPPAAHRLGAQPSRPPPWELSPLARLDGVYTTWSGWGYLFSAFAFTALADAAMMTAAWKILHSQPVSLGAVWRQVGGRATSVVVGYLWRWMLFTFGIAL